MILNPIIIKFSLKRIETLAWQRRENERLVTKQIEFDCTHWWHVTKICFIKYKIVLSQISNRSADIMKLDDCKQLQKEQKRIRYSISLFNLIAKGNWNRVKSCLIFWHYKKSKRKNAIHIAAEPFRNLSVNITFCRTLWQKLAEVQTGRRFKNKGKYYICRDY